MHKKPGVFMDILSNKAANEYAEYLLSNEESEEKVTEVVQGYHMVGNVVTLVGISQLDEDEANPDQMMYEEFMDAHGLLLELEEDLEKMIDDKATHVGVGFAWNQTHIKVVEIFSVKNMMINHLSESEDGGVEIRGLMLQPDVVLYAGRIVSTLNFKKDIKLVGPSSIQFDNVAKSFIINIEGPVENVFYSDEPKLLEIYNRKQRGGEI